MASTDPLELLPLEVVLQICLESSIPSLLRLEAVSKVWSNFLRAHSAYLWSHKSAQLEKITAGEESSRPSLSLSRPMAGAGTTETQQMELERVIRGKWSCDKDGWKGVDTWKDYCRREYLLHRNLTSPEAEMCHRSINTADVIVWRLRPDYENRLLICTAHGGGLWVYDLDSGELLWNRPREDVGPHAHLEHSQGTLAYNPGHDETIEIWRLAELVHPGRPSNKRGEYVQVARLPHDRELRGWHLLYPTLCVVSNQGQAWVYDVSADPPVLKTTIDMENGARGHLEQDENTVMFCMKKRGYHVYNKSTGEKLGELNPASWQLYGDDDNESDEVTSSSPNIFHIIHPTPAPSNLLSSPQIRDDSQAIHCDVAAADLRPGPLNDSADVFTPRHRHRRIDEEEWGAGMVSGPYMVGISRGGRVLIVSDWQAVLKDPSKAKDYAAIIECQADSGSHYDLGGWLTLGGAHGNQRAAWEVRDRVYLFPLPAPRTLPRTTQLWSRDGDEAAGDGPPPIHAIPATSDSQIPVPISFMQLTEDHLLTTYASIKLRPPAERGAVEDELGMPPPRLYMAKTPRFVSFAPWINAKIKSQGLEQSESDTARELQRTIHGGFWTGNADDGQQEGFFTDEGEDDDDADDDGEWMQRDEDGRLALHGVEDDVDADDINIEVLDGELVLTSMPDGEDEEDETA